MRHTLFTLFLCFSLVTNAQILNTESHRKVTDTSGFSGSASLDFALKRNKNNFFTFSTNIQLQYKMNKHLVLFKNDISFQKIEGKELENSRISQIRYNYLFHPRVAWELYTQGQYQKISLINFRAILGTGPRFQLFNSENYKFYIGTLVTYEHEELADKVTPIQRTVRGSCYLSFSVYPTKTVRIISKTNYHPKLSQFDDYRISIQSTLAIELFKNFDFSTNYTFIYDAFPAIGIPNSQYDFKTGIAYSFD